MSCPIDSIQIVGHFWYGSENYYCAELCEKVMQLAVIQFNYFCLSMILLYMFEVIIFKNQNNIFR